MRMFWNILYTAFTLGEKKDRRRNEGERKKWEREGQ
jgi:hypothetical protein